MHNVEKHATIFLLRWLFGFDRSQKIEHRYKNYPDNEALNAALLEGVMKWGFWIYQDWLLNGFFLVGIYEEGLQI